MVPVSLPKTVRVIVAHGGYGCETGCCGHWVELESGRMIGDFEFLHPWEGRDDFEQWARALAEEMVTKQFGPDHVADLDWENSRVVDD